MKIIVCGNTIETDNIYVITPLEYSGKLRGECHWYYYEFRIIMYGKVPVIITRKVEDDMSDEDKKSYLEYKHSFYEEEMINGLIEKYKPITEQKVKELRDFVEKHYAQNQSQIPKIDF